MNYLNRFLTLPLTFSALVMPLVFSSSALAVPVKFADCAKDTKVKPVPKGTGVIFNATCDQAYVLPPQAGTLEIVNVVEAGLPGKACQSYDNIESSVKSVTAVIRMNNERIAKYAEQIQEIEDQIDEGLIPLGSTIPQLEAKMAELESKLGGFNENNLKNFEALEVMKKSIGSAYAAHARFELRTDYQALVEAYQAANPDIHMERMPLEQSYLTVTELAPTESNPMSGVISITTPQGDYLPLLSNIRDPKEAALPGPVTPGGIISEGLSGNMALSVFGVCPLLRNGHLPKAFGMKDIKSYMAASVLYQYHVQAQRKHTITYNLAQLAKRIETSSKSGGFLSRKNVHSLVEESKSSKWINFETYEEDPTFMYTEEYKRDIKQQFLDSVLQEVAYVSFDENGHPPVVDPTGNNGVQAAAEGLGKCPYAYCQAAAYGLKFIDATFGKTTAVSNYIKTRDVDVKETVNETKMMPYFGSFPLQ